LISSGEVGNFYEPPEHMQIGRAATVYGREEGEGGSEIKASASAAQVSTTHIHAVSERAKKAVLVCISHFGGGGGTLTHSFPSKLLQCGSFRLCVVYVDVCFRFCWKIGARN
jgi:hypothetical protein